MIFSSISFCPSCRIFFCFKLDLFRLFFWHSINIIRNEKLKPMNRIKKAVKQLSKSIEFPLKSGHSCGKFVYNLLTMLAKYWMQSIHDTTIRSCCIDRWHSLLISICYWDEMKPNRYVPRMRLWAENTYTFYNFFLFVDNNISIFCNLYFPLVLFMMFWFLFRILYLFFYTSSKRNPFLTKYQQTNKKNIYVICVTLNLVFFQYCAATIMSYIWRNQILIVTNVTKVSKEVTIWNCTLQMFMKIKNLIVAFVKNLIQVNNT